jgi:inorganic pyrophosphatase
MQFYFDPDPGKDAPAIVRMVVEIRKDSSNKYEYDPSLGLFRLSRTLYSPMHYPGDYGFIPGTIADDGEPLDILCLVTNASFSGCLCQIRPVAVLDMLDGQDVDHKILAVPNRDPRYASVRVLADLDRHVQLELEHFFEIYKDLEGHVMQTRGWRDQEQAYGVIEDSRRRYLDFARRANEAPSESPSQDHRTSD